NRLALVRNHLFAHIVNSNLEVRTSVSINPETGAAEERALFSYEALPRGTVLVWEIIAKNPKHFSIGGQQIKAVCDPAGVHKVAKQAHPYLEHLGIGGMSTRGMGRVKVLYSNKSTDNQSISPGPPSDQPGSSEIPKESSEEASHE
ncbi:MAG: type III-B CRISPR module RAMP protein Cmr4, partial [Candidatus Caldatribacterium sp.]|nr:type III-B CRISPR module RAMP protein Cmr4 [Candidatus Caldatribacterium sp.]